MSSVSTLPSNCDLPCLPFERVLERSRRDVESWRYTPLTALLARPRTDAHKKLSTAAPVILTDLLPHQHRLVFVNGVFVHEQSSFGRLSPSLVQEDGAKGYRLIFAEQTCLVTAPIELVFINDGEKQENAIRCAVEIGTSASLTILERHLNRQGQSTSIMDVSFHLHSHAKLVHQKILHNLQNSVHLATATIMLDEGAYYQNFSLLKDSWLARNEIHVNLNGPLAQCALNGVMLLRHSEHIDTSTEILHSHPHGASRQFYKTIVGDAAHGVFQGKIVVQEGAQKTDGRQLSRALLLSDQAEMNAKPELQIFADDVSCSHGSTVGDLEPETLFYLRSRGLDETKARALLLHAFVNDVLDDVPEGPGRDLMRVETERWFDSYGS